MSRHDLEHVQHLRVNLRKHDDGYLYEFTVVLPYGAADASFARVLDKDSHKSLMKELTNTATSLQRLVEGLSAAQPRPEMSFVELGNALTRLIAPPELVEFLWSSASPLVITTNDPAFPWHLLLHDGLYLGLRRPLSVRLALDKSSAMGTRQSEPRHAASPRALLIADPTGNTPFTEAEVDEIKVKLKAAFPGIQIDILKQADATLPRVHAAFAGGYDIVHYAGHIQYDETSGGRRELVLWGDTPLPLENIHRFDFSSTFAFLNACWGGAAKHTFRQDSEGMRAVEGRLDGFGVGFVRGGARAFIAPIWPVFDGYAREFATLLYDLALGGLPLSEAVRQARARYRMAHPGDPTWAVYALYADAADTLGGHLAAKGQAAAPTAEPQAGGIGTHGQGQPHGAPREPGEMRGESASGNTLGARLLRRLLQGIGMSASQDAVASIDRAIATIESEGRQALHGLDLLNAVIASPKCSGLLAAFEMQDVTSSDLLSEAKRRFVRDVGRYDENTLAYGDSLVDAAHNAVLFAEQEGRDTLTSLDLAIGLLGHPRSSVKAVLDQLAVDSRQLLRDLAAPSTPASSTPFAPALGFNNGAIHTPPTHLPVEARKPVGTDLLADARKGSLRYVWGWTERQSRVAIPGDLVVRRRRDELMSRLVTALSAHSNPHVLLVSPRGVGSGTGKWAMVEGLAYALGSRAPNHQFSHLIECEMRGMRRGAAQDPSQAALAQRLMKFLAQAMPGHPIILAVEELTRFEFTDQDVIEQVRLTLRGALDTPGAHVILTSSDLIKSRQLLSLGVMARFTPIEVSAALPDEAAFMIAGHKGWIESEYGVTVLPESIREAACYTGSIAQPEFGVEVLVTAAAEKGTTTHNSMSIGPRQAPPADSAIPTMRDQNGSSHLVVSPADVANSATKLGGRRAR